MRFIGIVLIAFYASEFHLIPFTMSKICQYRFLLALPQYHVYIVISQKDLRSREGKFKCLNQTESQESQGACQYMPISITQLNISIESKHRLPSIISRICWWTGGPGRGRLGEPVIVWDFYLLWYFSYCPVSPS